MAMAFYRIIGYYVLKPNCLRFCVHALEDGKACYIQQHRVVRCVDYIHGENVLRRLLRKLTGKMVIELPAPDKRLAIIKKKDFIERFKEI